MPFSMAPKPEANVKTKDTTPPGWETEGEKREYFTILAYLDPAALKAAQQDARKTIVAGGRSTEEVNVAAYRARLFGSQLKGWRVLADPDAAPDPERMEIDGGYLCWKFTPQNVADLPWDIANWLDEQINLCGGGLATSGMITKAKDGTLLDFRRPDESVGTGEAPRGDDPV